MSENNNNGSYLDNDSGQNGGDISPNPADGTRNSGGSYQNPDSSYRNPENGYQNPNSGYQDGNGSSQNPDSGAQGGNGNYQNPNSGRQRGNGSYQNPNGNYSNGGYRNPNANYSNGNGSYHGNGSYQNPNSNYPNNGNYQNNGNGNYPNNGNYGGDNRNGRNNGNNGNNPNGSGNNNGRNNRIGIVVCCIIAILAVLVLNVLSSRLSDSMNKEISYKHFLHMLQNGTVAAVEIDSSANKLVIYPTTNLQSDGSYVKTYYTGLINDADLVARLNAAGVDYTAKIPDTGYTILEFFIVYVLPFVFIWGIFIFIYRSMSKGGGIMGVGKSNAKVYMEKETGVTFQDVAGQVEAKESVTELVDFLHNPGKYTKIGAKLPKGALLVGPPGTGKTLLAKAVAGEAKVPFFSLSGSDFVEMFVGVGASRVRDLFKQAQQQAPCIIFIDEIDAIGKSRDSHYGGGNDEREQTLNQLLSEMDGFDTSKGLVVLAATNRPEVLDKALLRPGRFDRRIIVDKPDLKGRVDILKVHAKNVSLDETVDFQEIAMATSGAVGSDLANMVNEAAIMAVKAGRQAVSQADLLEAVEVVIAGKEKKDRILSKKEKRVVAYHEVGHALVAALQKNSEPVQKITIVPRTMGALGYVMQVPEEEKFLMTRDEMLTEITTFCGGRAAEAIMFDSVTTGASNDIEKATNMARSMVTLYGMSEQFGLVGLESVENRYLDGRRVLNCSEVTAAKIDEEVMAIMKECYEHAYAFLQENREVMDRIAEFLYEKETITGKEFMRIFREMKGLPEPEEKTKEEKHIL